MVDLDFQGWCRYLKIWRGDPTRTHMVFFFCKEFEAVYGETRSISPFLCMSFEVPKGKDMWCFWFLLVLGNLGENRWARWWSLPEPEDLLRKGRTAISQRTSHWPLLLMVQKSSPPVDTATLRDQLRNIAGWKMDPDWRYDVSYWTWGFSTLPEGHLFHYSQVLYIPSDFMVTNPDNTWPSTKKPGIWWNPYWGWRTCATVFSRCSRETYCTEG